MAYTPKNPNGQATMANSSPVVVASDQSKIKVDLTDTTANAVAIKVDNSAVTQPISASTLPLPSGAATAAKQPALGTAGTASSDVLTVQGITSMTPIKTDGSGVTQPVSGTVTANAGTGTFTVDGSGVTQPVSAASLPLPSGASTSAKQPALGTAGTASSDVITVQGIASMTALKVDGSATTQPVSGTVTANAGTGSFTVAQSTAANLKVDISGSAANTTAGLISTKIDQTTNGTTNNVTNRDATYTKQTSASGTLVANTVTTQALTVSGFTAAELEITNISGASTIYYTLDGTTTPSSTTFSGILPATPCSVIIPCNGTTTVKLISAGTPTWGAAIRGV